MNEIEFYKLYNELYSSKSRDVKSVAGLKYYLDHIINLLNIDDYELVDCLLDSDKIDYLSDELIVCLLRSTFSRKEYLDNWTLFLYTAKMILTQRGHDTDIILKGLL